MSCLTTATLREAVTTFMSAFKKDPTDQLEHNPGSPSGPYSALGETTSTHIYSKYTVR